MKRTLLYLFGFIILFACRHKPSDIDRTYEEGVEVVLNHIEPYKIKGQPSRLILEEEIKIDLAKEEDIGLGLEEPSIVETDSQGNIYIVEQFPDAEYFISKFSPTGKIVKSSKGNSFERPILQALFQGKRLSGASRLQDGVGLLRGARSGS